MTAPGDDRLPVRAVFDAELVDDVATTPVDVSPPRAVGPNRWQRSRWVPTWLKSRALAIQALKDLVVLVLHSPGRTLGAVGRGLAAAARAWRRWVTVRDFREAAENAEKLADKFAEIRVLTLFRWRVTGLVIAVACAAVTIAYLYAGPVALWIGGLGVAAALAFLGRRTDGSPGRRAALGGPRSLAWTMDPQVLVDAFRDAKLIGKDEYLRLVERPCRIGEGWAVTVDLPATRKATDVIKNREALASALAVDEVQLTVDRVRGDGGHAGRVAMWVADKDPYATPPIRTPLIDVARWDVWRPVPFGRDARDRRVDVPVVWTSFLVGAIPRQGKTFATRLIAAGLIMDPFARLYVADFKGGKDWEASAQVAHRFMAGDESGDVLTFVGWLVELVTEVQGRFRRMRDLDDATCPESKVTPAMSRDVGLGMPITAVIVDEVQVPLDDRTPIRVEGKKLTAGEYVGELLTWLARKGPAAGIVMVLATQRPDSQTIPSGLRAVLGSRFALRVMDWRDSNIVLGEQMNTRGYDSSRLLAAHKGVGILRPDGALDGGDEVLATTVRTYYMPNEDWRAICERGRALRVAQGTLTGLADGHDTPVAVDHLTERRAIAAAPDNAEAAPVDRPALPEPLSAVATYLADELDGSERPFVSTAELADALGAEPVVLARQLAAMGCTPTRHRVQGADGTDRRVRGFLIEDIADVIARHGGTDEIDQR